MAKSLRRIPGIVWVLLLAVILRLFSLGDHVVWYDEAFSILFARNDLQGLLAGTLGVDVHPLLYYYSLHFWTMAFGENPAVVRFYSVLASLVTLGVLYFVVSDLFDRRTALVATLITTLSPFHLQYSQEARMYSLLAMFLMLTTWAFLRGSGRFNHDDRQSAGHRGWWILFGVSAGLAMHTQQLAAFYLAALGLIPLVWRWWSIFVRVVAGAGLAFLIYLPWIINVPGQLEFIESAYWVQRPTGVSLLRSVQVFVSGFFEFQGTVLMLTLALSLIVTTLLFVQLGMDLRRRGEHLADERRAVSVALWLVIVPIALMWSVSQVFPVYLERGLIGSVLMLFVLFAWLLTKSRMPRPIRGVVSVMGVIAFLPGIYAQYTLKTFPYSPVDEAMRQIVRDYGDDVVVVHQSKLTALPAEVYAPQLDQQFVQDDPASPQDTLHPATQDVLPLEESACLAAAIPPDAQQVVFVTLERAERELLAVGRADIDAALSTLRAGFQTENSFSIRDLNLYHYANPTQPWEFSC